MSKYFQKPDMLPAFNFIGGMGRYFYIPAYQRQFSWSNEKIKRLIEDIAEDMNRRMISTNNRGEVTFDGDTVSFIGTVVCFEDTDHKTVHPSVVNKVPKGVNTVIDGQQRLTVFIILSIILHDYIKVRMSDVGAGWLKDQCDAISNNLELMFEQHIPITGVHNYYPRMIRAFSDQWSTDNDKKYDSPISRYIFHYGNYHRTSTSSTGKREPFNSDEKGVIVDASFHKAIKCVQKKISKMCKGDCGEFPDIKKIFAQSSSAKDDLLKDLFNTNDFPSDAIDPDNQKHWEIARALLISVYLMEKVHFVAMVTKDEDYAFDIFDSLNTTGESLTAFETFKPEIVRAEGLEKYRGTESNRHEETISQYLDSVLEKRKSNTSEMLVSFALAENGEILSKKLHVQRTYLKEQYKVAEDIIDKRKFTQHLMHVSEVHQHFWNGNKTIMEVFDTQYPMSDATKEEIHHARFCMDFLRASGHSISMALVSRFYELSKLASDDLVELKVVELCKVIKAIAAFFALWRSCRGTDGIDARYRRMFIGNGAECFSRKRNNSPSLINVQKEFCRLLKREGGNSKTTVSSCEDWMKYAGDYGIYRGGQAIAKFILLIASHNTTEDKNNPGYLISARSGVNSILEAGAWKKNAHETVEHIIPQTKSVGEKPDDIHRLGNLTLLPKIVNIVFSNRDWDDKQNLFRMIAAETDEEFIQIARRLDATISENSIRKLREAKYLPMAEIISEWKNFSSIDHIDARGKNLMEMAWPTLSSWLDFDSH